MAILYQEKERIFTLHTNNTTYQMKVDEFGFLLHLYYGAKLSGNMDYLLTYYDRGFSGNPSDVGSDRTYSMDVQPQEYPGLGIGDYRSSALIIRNTDQSYCCDLRYKSHTIRNGKYALQGLPAVYADDSEAQTLEIVLEDAVSKVQVALLYGVLDQADIITRSAEIRNCGTGSICVKKAASACLDFVEGTYDLLSFWGRHTMERNLERQEIGHCDHVIGSRRGTSSHQYNPAVVIARKDATEDYGDCYGMVFVYSGNFMFEAEKDQFEQTRVIMGLHSDILHYPLKQGETLVIPETILSFSNKGFGALSSQFHRCIRNHICRGKYQHQPRPVLVNSWEAAYFNFNGETICQLAKDAAELGIDMVVMDDGWFGKREDDNSGLGDWQVNEKKLGCTLGELIQKVNGLGVRFGIWIEPEMVSEDSNLYRKHPDWVLQVPNREPVRGRNQLVLDFSRKEVRNDIFEEICSILDQGNIEYVKWDMNRALADIGSVALPPDQQGELSHRYMLAVYELQERLITEFPDLLLENCSSGGARFDPGMLYYSPQIWCSDDTDAIERLMIQEGTQLLYPMSAIGAHVSDCPNHAIGRTTPFETRGITALAGTFGYELDITKISEQERNMVPGQIAAYKKYAPLIREGDYYRIASYQENHKYDCYEIVSKDQSRAAVFFVQVLHEPSVRSRKIRLQGLKEDAVYEVDGRRYTGAALMYAGLLRERMFGDFQAEVIEVTEVV